MAEVRLDAMLKQFVPRTRLTSDAQNLDALLDDLEERFPRLRHRIRDETHRLRPFVKVFVNGEEVPAEAREATALREQDEVDILHSIQGG